MQTRSIPKRPDVQLTTLGLGGSQAGNLGHAWPDEAIAGSVAAAWRLGVRYVDTAPHYGLGLSERRLGRALASLPREELVLSTKVGRLLVPSPQTADRSDLEIGGFDVPADHRRQWDLSADGIARSIEQSLDRLGTDRIDIAYLHDPDDLMDQAVAEAIPALARLRDQGVVRAIGAGMNSSRHLARLVTETDVDVVLCAGRYTLLEQTALSDLLPAAERHRVGVVIGGVYNSGLLAVPRPPQDATYNYAQAPRELIERAHALADVCERHGVQLPQAALAFVAAHPAVVSILVGARSAQDVEDAAARVQADIPAQLWEDLRSSGLIAKSAPTP